MSKASEDKISLQNHPWQRELRAMALLSTLNYRTGELSSYLHNIACGVSELVGVDWSVVTLCQEGFKRVLASSIYMGEGEHVYSLHGQLTGTVIQIGCSLAVEDATQNSEYGEAPTDVKILGDKDKLKQVFINIICNACEAISAGDVAELKVNILCTGKVYINVHNQGEPISPELLTKLTQPFFSTKPDGTGLGLAITKRIVNAHGGELSINSDTATGTTVSVQLPMVS